MGEEGSRMRKRTDLAAVARRAYWREHDARPVVTAWRRSGESLSQFAARLGVDRRRLSRWAVRLERPTSGAMRFVPVRVSAEHTDARRGDVAGGIEIAWRDGRRIRVAPGFATDDLRRVLSVLDEGPC
jgi:hypothetical protein